ncbi:MmgE/PrpD family protein [Chitinophaga sp. CB10]|uniref:MmgE/PrpD family protein n=1 Tax=Chitinophaga sp. CB10 TaxID=1891659 RepID=UPI000AC72769|nr:MmgE/PrpD family protein [Chitinophaga sp. CB10]
MKTQIDRMADYVTRKKWEDMSPEILAQLKNHLLDSLASFVFSQTQETPQKVAASLQKLSNSLQLPADHAAQYYTTLIRYPDFMDNFLAKEATCHPSDNIGALLAACHLREVSGKDFLLAMAIAYELECRLTEQLPVMINGYDHTALLAFSATAGIGKLLGLTADEMANALAIAGCSYNPLVTSRASYTTEWKGLASSLVNNGAVNIAMMAREQVTGPRKLFELPEKGYNAIYGLKLEYDWEQENFDLIPRCILKTFNAEVHTQSALEAIQELTVAHNISPEKVKEIDITIFLTALHIVGNGEYGDRMHVYSKEQGDHSLPYVAAATLIDQQLYPPQLTPARIQRLDVQELLKRVHCHTGLPIHKPVKVVGMLDPYTVAYPDKVCSKVKITMNDSSHYTLEKEDYKGFFTRPLSTDEIKIKFEKMNADNTGAAYRQRLYQCIANLETRSANELLELLLSPDKTES